MFVAERLIAQNCAQSYESSCSKEASKTEKVNRVASGAISRSVVGDVFEGILKSRANWFAIGLSALVVGIYLAVSIYGFHAMPKPWMITTIATSSYVLAFPLLFAMGRFFHRKLSLFQKVDFEFSAVARLFKTNHHEIKGKDGKELSVNGNKIYLSALPNRLASHGEALQKLRVKAVLSLNEEWEVDVQGCSLPYQNDDWIELGMERELRINKDHKQLPPQELDACAEFINTHLQKGSVAVNCRGGAGRSAMAVAAYLIKYQNYTVAEACSAIKDSRPCSTIKKKVEGLNAYVDFLASDRIYA